MYAFSLMGLSVTDTWVTALKKLSTSQEATDDQINEMSKKLEERNTTQTKELIDFQKNQTQQLRRGSLSQNRGQIEILRKEFVVISELATTVTMGYLALLDLFFNIFSGKIKTRIFLFLENSHNRNIFNH